MANNSYKYMIYLFVDDAKENKSHLVIYNIVLN